MKTALVLLSFWLISGCSADISKDEAEITIKVISINAWYNLMPGGPPTFHIGGEVLVTKNADQIINLDQISILQQGKEIYQFAPSFELILQDTTNSLQKNQEQRFMFSTKPGLSINRNVDESLNISAVLHFSSGNAEISCTIDSLKIEKAY